MEGVDAHTGQATWSLGGLGRRLRAEGEEGGRQHVGPHRRPCHTDGLCISHSNLPRHISPCHHHRDGRDTRLVWAEGVAEGERGNQEVYG